VAACGEPRGHSCCCSSSSSEHDSASSANGLGRVNTHLSRVYIHWVGLTYTWVALTHMASASSSSPPSSSPSSSSCDGAESLSQGLIRGRSRGRCTLGHGHETRGSGPLGVSRGARETGSEAAIGWSSEVAEVGLRCVTYAGAVLGAEGESQRAVGVVRVGGAGVRGDHEAGREAAVADGRDGAHGGGGERLLPWQLHVRFCRYRFKLQSNLVWDSIKSISNFCFQF
jgi:hypothetical protein